MTKKKKVPPKKKRQTLSQKVQDLIRQVERLKKQVATATRKKTDAQKKMKSAFEKVRKQKEKDLKTIRYWKDQKYKSDRKISREQTKARKKEIEEDKWKRRRQERYEQLGLDEDEFEPERVVVSPEMQQVLDDFPEFEYLDGIFELDIEDYYKDH